MNSWIKLEINIEPQYLEEISGFLYRMGCSGIHEQDEGFSVYFSREDWNTDQQLLLQGFLKQVIQDFTADKIHVSSVKNQDWNEQWKENFKPLHISDSLIVLPEWESVPQRKGEQQLIVNPKMAFGTGHHESTRLVLRLVPEYLKEGSRVLDAGTGSGILAIYAVMSGAKRVTAFDNDPLAVENALENFKLNSVQDKIDVFCGELEQIRSEKFPLILANINRNVLLQLAKDFYSRASDAGLLILSGLLQEDFEQINNQYIKNGWRLLDQKREGEWLALVFEKDGTSV